MSLVDQVPADARSSADSTGKPWQTTFAVIGDFGNVSEKKNNLYSEKVPANYVGEAIRQFKPDFIISAGDDNYVEGAREWKEFNVGKNYAPYIYPYTTLHVNENNPEAKAFAQDTYLAGKVERKPWNRFFTAPGNHEVGMSGGVGFMEASGRRDFSHDYYYKAALEDSSVKGSVIPIASDYVYKGDTLYYDYSYGTSWMPSAWFKTKEGAMDRAYYDYIVQPTDQNGVVLSDLANIYMVDRNNTAYGTKNSAYAKWASANPGAKLDPQADFLMKEANRREDDVAWQIFVSHYQTFSSDSNLETMNLPFFSNGIDLVLGSHVHNYERIKAADIDGVTGNYIVNGAGGYNVAYYFGGKDWGANQLFSPIGSVPGYQSGNSGDWSFGVIDMNDSELMYRQFKVEFTRVENENVFQRIIGVGVDAYKGVEPLEDVRITEIDRLILRKEDQFVPDPIISSASPELVSLFSAGPSLSSQTEPANRVTSGVSSVFSFAKKGGFGTIEPIPYFHNVAGFARGFPQHASSPFFSELMTRVSSLTQGFLSNPSGDLLVDVI